MRMAKVLVNTALSRLSTTQTKGEFHKELGTERHTKMPPVSTFLDTALLSRQIRGFKELLDFG